MQFAMVPLEKSDNTSFQVPQAWPPDAKTNVLLFVILFLIALSSIWVLAYNVKIGIKDGSGIVSDFALSQFANVVFVGVVPFWIAYAISRSRREFGWNAFIFSLLLFAMLALVLNKDRHTFWIAFVMLIAFGTSDIVQLFSRRALSKAVAESLFTVLFWLTVFYFLSDYLLHIPRDFFSSAIEYLSRVRATLASVLVAAILITSLIKIVPEFNWDNREYFPEKASRAFVDIVSQPLIIVANYLLNVLSNLSILFHRSLHEVWLFVKDVLSDLDLWRTIFRTLILGVFSFLVPFSISLAIPFTVEILRNPSIIQFGSAKITFSELLIANFASNFAFIFVSLFVLGIIRTWLWLREDRSSRGASTARVTNAAATICVCAWAATLIYYYPINLAFELHADLLCPGIFSLIALPFFGAGFLIARKGSRDERTATSVGITEITGEITGTGYE